ncbi:MAG: hypothetical protein ACR2OR_15890, partial [Hyphomicrobiales bacterium]
MSSSYFQQQEAEERNVMRKLLQLALFSLLGFVVTPAYAGQAVQVFVCEIEDELTEEVLIQRASAWLKAAKTVKGGENLKASLHDPVAGNMKQGDVLFVV